MTDNQELLDAKKKLAKGRELITNGQYKEGGSILKSLPAIFEKYEEWENYIWSNGAIAEAKIATNNKIEAKKILETTIIEGLRFFKNTHPSISYCRMNYAVLHIEIGKYIKAQELCLKLIQDINSEEYINKYNNTIIIRAYINLGTSNTATHNCFEGIKYYDEALKRIKESKNTTTVKMLPYLYGNKGITLYDLEDFDQALSNYQKAIYIWEIELKMSNHLHMAHPYLNIANCYNKLRKWDLAQKYYDKVILLSKGHYSLALLYANINIANIHYENRKYKKAIQLVNTTLKKQKKGFEEEFLYVKTLQTLAISFQGLKDFKRSINIYKKNINLMENFNNDIEKGIIHIKLADCYYEAKDYKNGLQQCYFAYTLLTPKTQAFKAKKQKNIPHNSIDSSLLLLFKVRAKLHYALHQHNNSLSSLKNALQDIQNAINLYNILRKNIKVGLSTYFLSQETQQLFDLGLKTVHELYKNQKDKQLKEQAFSFIEKSRAVLLLNQIQEANAKLQANIPQTILDQEKELQLQLNYIEKTSNEELLKPNNQHDETQLTKWNNQYFELYEQYKTLNQQLEKEYPRYHQLKHDTSIITINSLQSVLAKDQLMIQFFVGEDSIYIFTISHNIYDFQKIEKPSSFENILQQYNNSIIEMSKHSFIRNSIELYQILFNPIQQYLKDKKNLTLIPDTTLSVIPFEALLTQKPKTANYKDFSYLIKKYNINYHYSATLYYQGKFLPQIQPSMDFGGFAPIFKNNKNNDNTNRDNTNQQYAELTSSKQEIKNVQNQFEKQKQSTEVFLYHQASLQNFKKNAHKYKYILIATHGKYSEENPNQSSIIFFNEKKETNTTVDIFQHPKDNHRLYLTDAYALKLNAELIVLSCCYSGRGEAVKGEGILGINRGFLYAGPPNIVYTLFPVDDEKSTKLIKLFFQYFLEQKLPYAQALRQAKLQLIEKNDTIPFYWTGYVLLSS